MSSTTCNLYNLLQAQTTANDCASTQHLRNIACLLTQKSRSRRGCRNRTRCTTANSIYIPLLGLRQRQTTGATGICFYKTLSAQRYVERHNRKHGRAPNLLSRMTTLETALDTQARLPQHVSLLKRPQYSVTRLRMADEIRALRGRISTQTNRAAQRYSRKALFPCREDTILRQGHPEEKHLHVESPCAAICLCDVAA